MLTQAARWKLEDTVKEALRDLAQEQGLLIDFQRMDRDGRYVDVEVDGERFVLEHSSDVREDFAADPTAAAKQWRPDLKDSYWEQIETARRRR